MLGFVASVKRLHENWASGNGGFWEDHRASTSSRSIEVNSPSSSNVSVRKKMVSVVFAFDYCFLQKLKG